MKRVNMASYGVPLFLLLMTIGSAVAAMAYVIYQFNINATAEQYPKVTFWDWSASQKKNTFDYAVRIFPSIKTIDENITNGIYCDDTSSHTCYLRINGVTSPSNVAKLNITIYDASGTVFTKEWTSFSSLPTAWESFTAAAGKKYAIRIEITASSGATGSSSIAAEMKVENP